MSTRHLERRGLVTFVIVLAMALALFAYRLAGLFLL
jgi:hypothetical protein